MKICVVGAGPAGLYFTKRILKLHPNVKINVIERRPYPFGLLKFGVAPDHPEVKNCMSGLQATLSDPRVSTYYGVNVGHELAITDLTTIHDAVILCTGAPKSKNLNIPGCELKNSFTAEEIVGWYNNDNGFANLPIDLSSVRDVAIIGNGNVALDIARILLKPVESLSCHEIPGYALNVLKSSNVLNVDIIGRRSPYDASFTSSELREIFELKGVEFTTNTRISKKEVGLNDRKLSRLITVLEENISNDHSLSTRKPEKSLSFKFFCRPVRFTGNHSLESICFENTEIRSGKLVGNGIIFEKEYQLAVSCIGFAGECDFGLMSTQDKILLNTNGEVPHQNGLFTCGWAATGAFGNISSTMRHSFAVADRVAKFLNSRNENNPSELAKAPFMSVLRAKGISSKW